jgi:archaellum biogenesis ATPase FlaH
LWLAKTELDYAVHPSNLGVVRDKILDFLSTNENAVVLLDGFEYLVTANGFDVALKFLHDLRETVVLRHARLFVPIAPEVFETKRLELLKRYLTVIEVAGP